MSSLDMAVKIINSSPYSEFPDIIATIRLAIKFANIDKRDPNQAMRACARLCLNRAANTHLRNNLIEMSKSANPNMELANLVICYTKMRDELAASLKGKSISKAQLNSLQGMSYKDL